MNIHVCDKTAWLDCLLTTLRNVNTGRGPFRKAANLIAEYLVVQAINLGFIPTKKWSVQTPTGASMEGASVNKPGRIMVVPIMRAGNVFVEPILRVISMDIQVGHLLIQRDENSALPKVLFDKLTGKVEDTDLVILLDPMLATGGTILAAVDLLVAKGVELDKIVLLHAIACPEGINALRARYPTIKAVIGVEDSHLDERKYIVPGLGDFGDRYYSD